MQCCSVKNIQDFKIIKITRCHGYKLIAHTPWWNVTTGKLFRFKTVLRDVTRKQTLRSFVMTTTKTLRSVFLWHTSIIKNTCECCGSSEPACRALNWFALEIPSCCNGGGCRELRELATDDTMLLIPDWWAWNITTCGMSQHELKMFIREIVQFFCSMFLLPYRDVQMI